MRINAEKAHRRMWNWKAENPEKEIEECPDYKQYKISCYACYVLAEGITEVCPLAQRKCPSGYKCFPLWEKWIDAPLESKEESKLAKKIANMKWVGPKMITMPDR